jgi:hypothetical protein
MLMNVEPASARCFRGLSGSVSLSRGLHWAVPFALLVAVCCGCGGGGDDVDRHDVSGSVTFDGQPVPKGRIIFEPDASAGNSGATGVADIVDGKYDTATGGKGTIGGPHVARLEGRDASGGLLFVDHTEKVDLPKQAGTHDFQVPASAAAPKQTEDPGPPP